MFGKAMFAVIEEILRWHPRVLGTLFHYVSGSARRFRSGTR
jgi:hypothetical protein